MDKKSFFLGFIVVWLICDNFLGSQYEQTLKSQLNRIEAKQQQIEDRIKDVSLDVEILQLDDIGIFETIKAIEQDSFYSNE